MKRIRFDVRLGAAALVVAIALAANLATAADPWADRVVRYTPGAGVGSDFVSGLPYTDDASALGEPTRVASPDSFPGVVTPLQAPFRSNEIVSVGRGGEIVLAFDEPVVDDPLNPYGIDLLIFGNSFFVGAFFNPDFSFNPAGTAVGVFSGGGRIEVSADDDTYISVTGEADGLYPTRAFLDVDDPFGTAAGAAPADFTMPVDPAFNPLGKTFAQIVAGYGLSGGGAGIDLAATGLASISYVRITNPTTALATVEIDALADVRAVPEPAASIMAGIAVFLLGRFASGSKVKLV